MAYAFRNDEAVTRAELNAPILKVDQEAALDYIEELVLVIVLMPVVFALHDSKPYHGVVHCTKGLVVPGVDAVICKLLYVNEFKAAKADVHVVDVPILHGRVAHVDISKLLVVQSDLNVRGLTAEIQRPVRP